VPTGALRRGLPRRPGGGPWPPADAVGAAADAVSATADVAHANPTAATTPADAVTTSGRGAPLAHAPGTETGSETRTPGGAGSAGSAAPTMTASRLRRGLPRRPGADAWPPAAEAFRTASAVDVDTTPAAHDEHPTTATSRAPGARSAAPAPRGMPSDSSVPASSAAVPAIATTLATAAMTASGAGALRRGLPRRPGGTPWPPAGAVPAPAALAPARASVAGTDAVAAGSAAAAASAWQGGAGAEPTSVAPVHPLEAPETPFPEPALSRPVPPPAPATAPVAAIPARPATAPSTTAPERPPVAPAKPAAPSSAAGAKTFGAGRAFGPYTSAQWIGTGIVIAVALSCLALLLVAVVRGVLSLPALRDFLATYPGTYALPPSAPVGIPAWLGWQHFCNVFLMVLIIRSGLQVRRQKRPPAYWTSKRNPRHKVSITAWLHQALDLLWLVNGVIFVVLLFATGQWMRLVPTSWAVFPNGLSAVLQYLSMNWPTENGWVDYNALQQLFYFATVFLAAPLAAVTGFRMSGLWPAKAAKLSAAYPVRWARRLHFPVMIYFVTFIMVHVTLVFSTGALRNLDHMYAAKGSTNPNAYTGDWTGFWMFAASLVVIAAAWIAARPTVVAPIARLFGSVSSR
jgi:thiosulfate reductase cytochrome b subunit